jgi:hypothetical protein
MLVRNMMIHVIQYRCDLGKYYSLIDMKIFNDIILHQFFEGIESCINNIFKQYFACLLNANID